MCLTLQISWCGFFFAAAIGVHYIFHCLWQKKKPDTSLLAILVFAPLSSLLLNFTIMAAGFDWQWQKIIDLYRWRAAKGELAEFVWGLWFKKLWEFAVTNFTLPVLIITIGYLTLGQLLILISLADDKEESLTAKRFPQFWLFLMPAIFQLFILRGSLWKHQFWEAPLVPFVAIAAAQGIMLAGHILSKINPRLAKVGIVILIGVIFVSCVRGLNYYYSIRWQPPAKIKMLKELNEKIPPDKMLLSFEDFVVNQHPVKGPHYRPEIAWYLDREIAVAQTIEDIKSMAKTGKYPYYLVPLTNYTSPLVNQLAKQYRYEHVPSQQHEITKDGKFLKAGMMSYFIFDLNSSIIGG